MYTFIFVLLFLTPFYTVVSQNYPASSKEMNQTDEKGMKQGYWEVEYPNGNVRYKGVFRDDKPVGEFLRFFPDGSKMAVMDFCESGIRADSRLFYEGGGLAAEGVYINQERDSIWKFYSYYDNRLSSMETYKEGEKNGPSEIYYPDGQVSEYFMYREGVRNGIWKQYYEDGVLKLESSFKDNKRHGNFTLFSPGGRVEVKGQFFNNQMEGEWIYYDQFGEVISEITYTEGVPENEADLIEKEQEMFRQIEMMRGRIPEPDTDNIFSPRN